MLVSTFKERLNEALRLRNIKPAELSRRSGVSRGTLSRYLHGDYMANQMTLTRLAVALDVQEAWLMGHDVDYHRQDPAPSPEDQLKIALYGTKDIPEEMWRETLLMVAFLKQKYEEENKL